MKACRSYQPRLVLLASGDADSAETTALRRHCAQCPACAAYLEELSGLCHGLRQSPVEVPLDDERFHRSWISRIATVERAVQSRKSPGVSVRFGAPAWSWLWIGGFAVVLGVVAWLAMESRRVPPVSTAIAAPSAGRHDAMDGPLMASSTVSVRSYRSAVRRSSEAFDQLLARNAQEMAPGNEIIHAFRGPRLEIAE